MDPVWTEYRGLAISAATKRVLRGLMPARVALCCRRDGHQPRTELTVHGVEDWEAQPTKTTPRVAAPSPVRSRIPSPLIGRGSVVVVHPTALASQPRRRSRPALELDR
jgi:hypothetical protein